MKTPTKFVPLALAAAGLLVGLTSPTASASSGRDDDGVQASGTCSQGATWKLEVKPDDGALEVEAEVDSNVAGQTWAWAIRDNGALAASGRSTTAGRSGSFSVERKIPNAAGADTVVFRATYRGQVCRGVVRY